MDLIDIGANLTHESFAADLDEVMTRAWHAGVRRLVVTGADASSSTQAAALAERNPRHLRSTAGIHPHHADTFNADRRAELADLLQHPLVVAAAPGIATYADLPLTLPRGFVAR